MTDTWRHAARRIEADALDDLRGHRRLQSPEGQQFLDALQKYVTPETAPFLPWLAREFRKQRLFYEPTHGGTHLWYDSPDTAGTRRPLRLSDLSHWADWYHSPDRRRVPLDQLKIQDMPDEIRQWEREMARKANEAELMPHAPEGKVVHQFPDGWTVRQLPSSALPFEGWAMRGDPTEFNPEGAPICVGDPQYQRAVDHGHVLIHSLRDPQHMPHVTMEIDPQKYGWTDSSGRFHMSDHQSFDNNVPTSHPIPHNGVIRQIQGKGNSIPKPEYQARMKDWFQTFPEDQRPNWDYQQSPIRHIAEIDPYHPDRKEYVDEADPDMGGYTPHGDYGLVEPQRPTDYEDVIKSIVNPPGTRDWGSTYDPEHINRLYQHALERREIPELAAGAHVYDEHAMSDFSDLTDMNDEYLGRYPGEDYEEEPERWDEVAEANPHEYDSGQDAFDQAYRRYRENEEELQRDHVPTQVASQLFQRLRPHWVDTLPGGPTGESVSQYGGYVNPPEPQPEPPQAPQQPGTVSKVAMPIVPTKWDVLNRPRADYVGEMPQYPGDREDFANRRPEWQAWRDAAQPEYDAHRQREEEWDRAARNAMATGRMTPEQVVELGYHPSNHETDGGWGAPKWGRWRPLPERLYHVTSNLPAIAQSGVLRSPHELDLAGKGRGLGGGTQDTISLTDSREEAENIKRAILEGADVASGRLPIERMVEMAANGEGTNEPWLKKMFGNYDWSQGNPQALDDLLLGRKPFYTHLLPEDHPLRQPASGLGGVRSAEEWARHGYYPYPGAYALGQPGSPMYNERSVYRNLTPEEKAHEAFEWWRNPWASMRSWSGGPSDPIFTGVDSHWFAKLDPSHVGIIEAQPVPGGHGYPLSSLGEWRIPTGEAVNITGINGQPYTPPVTSRTAGDGDGYVTCDQGHQHWGRNGAAGALLRHVDPQGQERYLLTLRSPQVHEGDCWGVPGGALDSHEQPHEAALRETQEELGTLPQVNNLRTLHTNDHGGWAYTTVTGDVAKPFQPDVSGWETTDAGWFTPQEVDRLPLHSGFAQTWQQLRGRQSKTAMAWPNELYHVSPAENRESIQREGLMGHDPSEAPMFNPTMYGQGIPGNYAFDRLEDAQQYARFHGHQQPMDIWQLNHSGGLRVEQDPEGPEVRDPYDTDYSPQDLRPEDFERGWDPEEDADHNPTWYWWGRPGATEDENARVDFAVNPVAWRIPHHVPADQLQHLETVTPEQVAALPWQEHWTGDFVPGDEEVAAGLAPDPYHRVWWDSPETYQKAVNDFVNYHRQKSAAINAQPLYKRWVYSPASGQVTLSDNSGDPLAVKYHTDLARERNEPNLVHGTAVRIGNGWRLFDWESKPLEDPHIIAQVMAALRTSNGASDPHTASWDPSMDDADWTRVHHGLPS